MRRDQINFAACQLRLLILDVATQRVRREDTGVRVAPLVSHLPVADENHDRPNPNIQLAVFFDPRTLPSTRIGLVYCGYLYHRVRLWRKISRFLTTARFLPGFGLRCRPALPALRPIHVAASQRAPLIRLSPNSLPLPLAAHRLCRSNPLAPFPDVIGVAVVRNRKS